MEHQNIQAFKRRRIINNDINNDNDCQVNYNFNNFNNFNLGNQIKECLDKINIIGNILAQNQIQIDKIIKNQEALKNHVDNQIQENLKILINKNENIERNLDNIQNVILSTLNNQSQNQSNHNQIEANLDNSYFS